MNRSLTPKKMNTSFEFNFVKPSLRVKIKFEPKCQHLTDLRQKKKRVERKKCGDASAVFSWARDCRVPSLEDEVGTTKTFIYRENRRTRVFSSMALRITDGICPIFSSGSSRRAHNLHFSHLKSTRRLTSVATERRRYRAKVTATVNPYSNTEAARPEERKSLRDFLSEAENFYTSDSGDGGPPRWFSPLQCSSHAPGSPLLLYIPGSSFWSI